MDYSKWVMDVVDFFERIRTTRGMDIVAEIAPPLRETELSALSQSWPCEIPSALKEFWATGSSHLNCGYSFDEGSSEPFFPLGEYIRGGPEFEPAKYVFPGNSGLTPSDDVGNAEECRLYCESAIFQFGGGGENLALDVTSGSDDPPVVHLGKDSEATFVISPSFTVFLENWAQMSYIGPDCWQTNYWRDEVSGFIDPEKYKSSELRSLLLTGN